MKHIALLLILIQIATGLMVHAATAGDQKASSTLISNPKAVYNSAKSVMTDYYNNGYIRKILGGPLIENNIFDVTECGPPSEMFSTGFESERLHDIMDVAFHSVVWRNELIGSGYPESLIDPIFSRYELKSIANGGSNAALENLVHELKLSMTFYRRKRRSLPRFKEEGGCGAGGVSARLTAKPSNAQIFYITEFNYRLCKLQMIDPENRDQCDLWSEAHKDIVSEWSGDYRYVARWTDGKERKGTFYLNSDNGTDIVLSIEKP